MLMQMINGQGLGFHDSSDNKEPAHNVEDTDSIPGVRKIPWDGNGNTLQYSCLGNPVDRGACWAIVHDLAKSQTWLSD